MLRLFLGSASGLVLMTGVTFADCTADTWKDCAGKPWVDGDKMDTPLGSPMPITGATGSAGAPVAID